MSRLGSVRRWLLPALATAIAVTGTAVAPPISSAATATATFGKTTVGATSDAFLADRKRVNRYTLPTAGTVSKLSIYLQPGTEAGTQNLEGIIYADSGGAPGARLAVSTPLAYASSSTAGWRDLTFSTPVSLAPGNYWIGVITGSSSHAAGFRYTSVASSRDYNANSYSTGPTNPFGTPTVDGEQTSLYATYTYQVAEEPPKEEELKEPPKEEPPLTGSAAGHVLYQGDAASWADGFVNSTNAAWLASHWTFASRYYPPYGNGYPKAVPGVKWTPYRDAWTHNSEGGESGANRFRLETQAGRESFLVGINEDFARGDVGSWLDDWQYWGGHKPTAEPEAKQWNEGETATVEAIRKQHPTAYITENSHWFEIRWAIRGGSPEHPGKPITQMLANRELAVEPAYDRNLKALSGHGSIFEEWGIGQQAALRFGSSASYAEWLALTQYLGTVYHVGRTVGWGYSEGSNLEPLEWDLATLLLVSDGSDAIDGGHQYPTSWPRLYELDLGEPLGPRTRTSSGLWERDFSKGRVYTVEPGGAEAHITLPEPLENSKREHVTSLTLKANQGAVLAK